MSRIVITGAAGFIGSHLAEALLHRGHSVVGIDNLLTGATANIAHLVNRDFHFIKHDITNYIFVEGPVDAVPALGEPCEPDRLSRAADSHAQGWSARHPQGARPRQREEGALRSGVHVGSVRRSPRAPAEGNLLGERESDRPQGRLRRSQALRRGHDDGVSPLPRRGHQDRPDLQYVRSTHAPARRPRHSGLHEPGAPRRGHHDLRQRKTDTELLLRQRPRGRDHQADGVEPARSDQHRKSSRDDDRRDRARHPALDGILEQARLQAAARGRSQGPATGHHEGPHVTWLGAQGPARGRADQDAGLFPDQDLGRPTFTPATAEAWNQFELL